MGRREGQSNLKKHGVTFIDAVDAVEDERAILDMDDETGETRLTCLGMSLSDVLFVVTVDRGNRTRIISAREATKFKSTRYERGA